MEVNLGLVVVIALLALLGYWRERALNLYRVELRNVSEVRASLLAACDALEDANAGLKRRVSEQQARIDVHSVRIDDLHARHASDLTAVHRYYGDREHELWERIRDPAVEPVPATAASAGPRKLHHDEDDEIAGRTVADVAAKAGLSSEQQRAIAHIDEIATSEGVDPS